MPGHENVVGRQTKATPHLGIFRRVDKVQTVIPKGTFGRPTAIVVNHAQFGIYLSESLVGPPSSSGNAEVPFRCQGSDNFGVLVLDSPKDQLVRDFFVQSIRCIAEINVRG